MDALYHLRNDSSSLALMQRASLDPDSVTGFRITHGLVGTDEWWSHIAAGTLKLQRVRGKVSGFWPGQWCGGPAEFELQADDGKRSKWLCEIEPEKAKEAFQIGRAVEVQFVVQDLKSAFQGSNETKVTISILPA